MSIKAVGLLYIQFPCGYYREIGRMDPRDLARDTSGTRAYADFLVELAGRERALEPQCMWIAAKTLKKYIGSLSSRGALPLF